MLTPYIQAAMRKAHYEVMSDDHTFVGTISGFQGVWANTETLEQCREELQEVLEEWMLLRLSKGLSLPIVDGIELAVKEVA